MIRSETTAPLPAQAETAAPIPGPSSTSGRLPGRSETTLPAGMIPKFPPRTWATFTGAGALSAAADAGAVAAFAGAGTLSSPATPHAFATATFTGVGALTAYVLNQSATAQFSGLGTLAAVARPAASAAFSGSGTLGSVGTAGAAAKFTGSGALSGPATPVASAAFTGLGTLSAVAQTAVRMGIDKVNTQSIPGGSYTKITSWAVRTTSPGFPDTDLFNDGIRLRAGTYSTIEFKATIENGRQMALRIMKNGTTQLASSDSGGNVLTWTVTATNVTLVNGDLITVEANPTAGRIIQSGASNTYVIATPA